jgi:hypothetical protein
MGDMKFFFYTVLSYQIYSRAELENMKRSRQEDTEIIYV